MNALSALDMRFARMLWRSASIDVLSATTVMPGTSEHLVRYRFSLARRRLYECRVDRSVASRDAHIEQRIDVPFARFFNKTVW